MRASVVLATYTVILLLMGVYGFLKSGSGASLLMSALFSAALTLCMLRLPKNQLKYLAIASLLLAVLLLFFAIRWWLSGSFFPSGLMTLVSAVSSLFTIFFVYRAIGKTTT